MRATPLFQVSDEDAGNAAGGGPTLRRPRVLIVDDEFLIRWSLREQLVAEHMEVEEAATAAEARAHFRAGAYQAVLLDLRLPDSDGLDLLRELLGIQPTPVIVITAHGTDETAMEAKRLGAYGFMRKPFDVEAMVELLAAAVLHGAQPNGDDR